VMRVSRLLLATGVSCCSLVGGLLLSAPTALAVAPPTVEEESVLDVAATSATLQAKIDPQGSETTYRFEYGTSEAYGSSIPAPDGLVGSGSAGVTLSAHPQDLLPRTAYHYRVVALVAARSEVVAGGDGTFRTQPAGSELALPDGRQWELVSPANKRGALFGSLRAIGPIQAAEDGDGIAYDTSVPTEAEPPGYQGTLNSQVQLISTRSSQGWSSRVIAVPHGSRSARPELTSEYRIFSPDLALGLVSSYDEGGTLLSSLASEPTPYIRRESLCDEAATADECFMPLLTSREGSADVPAGTKFSEKVGVVQIEGASPDLNHVALDSSVPLTHTPIPKEEIYEWSADAPAADAVQMVSVLPASEGGGPAALGFHMSVGGTLNEYSSGARNAISSDGSRIFWGISPNNEEGEGSGRLYMRDTVKEETVRLDAAEPGVVGGGEASPRFQFASSDGSKVYFTDGRPLTATSGGGPVVGEKDLYECEIVEIASTLSCKLTDLTPERSGHPADVQLQLSGVSENGSYVYFVADGVLGDGAERGATQGKCGIEAPTPPSATCNLYEYRDGSITFIATLSAGDENDWGGTNSVEYQIANLTAQASPDGRYFAFMSQRPLTAYDNRDSTSGEPDQEVYLYDAQSRRLVCVSCDPTNSRPSGVRVGNLAVTNLAAISEGTGGSQTSGGPEGGYGANSWAAADLPSGDRVTQFGSLYQPRYLTDDGRLFFDSSDALAPQDVNGTEDVYEYEPDGVGDCTAANVAFEQSSAGCVSLISSGSSLGESGFMDASKGGGDVFFQTESKLVSQDYDTSFDLYDAHECSASSPCTAPPVVPLPCTSGDSCKAAPSPQPSIFGVPASATFTGTGDLVISPAKAIVRHRSLTRAQKLARALRTCRKKHEHKRVACERQSRKRYGAKAAPSAVRATNKDRG
jgi:hypothetical protein